MNTSVPDPRVAGARPPIAWHVTRWGDDPYSRGSWSVLRPGGTPEHRRVLGTPIDDRFVIAGEAVDLDQPTMLHGAAASGVRAAEWVLASGGRSAIVVGAGIAGLSAARRLRDEGCDVLVVEARSRIGGRIHTVRLASTSVDVGAAWLQQDARNPLARLAEHLGLELRTTDFRAPLAGAPDGPVGDVAGALDRMLASIDPTGAPLADQLAAHLTDLAPPDARLARFAIAGDLVLESGVEPRDMSLDAIAEDGVGAGDRWLPDGLCHLVDHLASDVDVRLATPVRSIEWDADGVSVDWMGADRCICTVPVGVLPSIEFHPGLPASHRDALAHLAMGVVDKVVLQFDERWWPIAPSGYLRWYDSPPSWGEWLDLTDAVGVPTVAGLVAADAVRAHHHGRTDAEVARAATAALAAWASAVGDR